MSRNHQRNGFSRAIHPTPAGADLPPSLGIQTPNAQGVHLELSGEAILLTAFQSGQFVRVAMNAEQAATIGVMAIKAGAMLEFLRNQAEQARDDAPAAAIPDPHDDLLAEAIAAVSGDKDADGDFDFDGGNGDLLAVAIGAVSGERDEDEIP